VLGCVPWWIAPQGIYILLIGIHTLWLKVALQGVSRASLDSSAEFHMPLQGFSGSTGVSPPPLQSFSGSVTCHFLARRVTCLPLTRASPSYARHVPPSRASLLRASCASLLQGFRECHVPLYVVLAMVQELFLLPPWPRAPAYTLTHALT